MSTEDLTGEKSFIHYERIYDGVIYTRHQQFPNSIPASNWLETQLQELLGANYSEVTNALNDKNKRVLQFRLFQPHSLWQGKRGNRLRAVRDKPLLISKLTFQGKMVANGAKTHLLTW